ncbi:GxxExxY protein [Lacihabitans sp. CS3-21]|uniref:GxxExxY protein n=1 Tax=Lacihabitans sp. CS3-21 TaxID=2487332 RepID=UPI0020CF456B|nr:GxxExxY protein [Lacihabitans sp. CS3-21]MCP9747512.1 GxxExxY protein [Lacihabitans sp. CS3-21]
MTKKKVTQLSYEIMNAAIEVHNTLGLGLLESVYEKCLKHELISRGHFVSSQLLVPIDYKGINLQAELRIDLLVDDLIIIEVKAVENLHPAYEAQVLTYMKLLTKPQGLVINFFSRKLKESYIPLVNDYFRQLPD